MELKELKELRNRTFKLLFGYGNNIKTKFNNINGKTTKGNVPEELFQKRTSRNNRVLISWKTVVQNNINFRMLKSFQGDVAVEFVNDDFNNPKYRKNPLFARLKALIGSDHNVSAIITFRNENGTSDSSVERLAFSNFISGKGTKIKYKGQNIHVNETNYREYALKQENNCGKGNNQWSGFLFVSIKGGQQESIETHNKESLSLFNPAREYASKNVMEHINLALSYMALKSIEEDKLDTEEKNQEYNKLVTNLGDCLKQIKYSNPSYKGNLLDYCNNHPCLAQSDIGLLDPIQLENITIDDFDKKDRLSKNVDLTHDEAVEKDIFYWDSKEKTILSAARPTNLFWSFHESNMIQQGHTLEEYFVIEDSRYKKRHNLI